MIDTPKGSRALDRRVGRGFDRRRAGCFDLGRLGRRLRLPANRPHVPGRGAGRLGGGRRVALRCGGRHRRQVGKGMERQRRHARVALRLGGDALRIGFGAGRAARVVAGQGAHQRLPFEIVVGGEQLGPGLHVLAGVERLGDRQAEIRWRRQLHQTDAQQVSLRRQAGRERLGGLPRRRVMRPIRRFVADRVRVKPGFLPRHGGDIGRRHSRRRAVRRGGQLQDSGKGKNGGHQANLR